MSTEIVSILSDSEPPLAEANNTNNDNSTIKIEEYQNTQANDTAKEVTVKENEIIGVTNVDSAAATTEKLVDEDTTKNIDFDVKQTSDKQQLNVDERNLYVTKIDEQSDEIQKETLVVLNVQKDSEISEQTNKNTQEESLTGIQQTTEEEKNKNELVKTEKPTVEKHGLPKWMVQSANASPSPSPEATDKAEQKEPPSTTLTKGRRGRRPANERPVAEAATIASQEIMNESSSLRPRRSTRSRVDYANPDPLTVLAEVDDEEPYGRRRIIKGQQLTGNGSTRGRKRKIITAHGETEHDDDDDEEYGSRKRSKKRASGAKKTVDLSSSITPIKRGRGRPAGSKTKNKLSMATTTKAVNVGKGGNRRRRKPIESDDEHEEEVQYDDHESEKETTDDESIDEMKHKIPITPRKIKINSSLISANTSPKQSPKKRGRPPAGGHQQQKKDPQLFDVTHEDDGNKNGKSSASDRTELHEQSSLERINDNNITENV